MSEQPSTETDALVSALERLRREAAWTGLGYSVPSNDAQARDRRERAEQATALLEYIGKLDAQARLGEISFKGLCAHNDKVVALEAELSTLRESLAEANRLLSLHVAEVERLKQPGEPAARWQPPPNTPEEFALLRKCITAAEYIDNGDPLKDVMDREDIEGAIRLLLKFEQQLTDMVCGGPMGSPPPTKSAVQPEWERPQSYEVADLLMLVDVEIPNATIDDWTNEQVRHAMDWAAACHLRASDNDDVEIPPRPTCIDEYLALNGAGNQP